VILFGLSLNADLGEVADNERRTRTSLILDAIYSLGPAWMANQGSVLLKTKATREEVRARVAQLFGTSDLAVVMEVAVSAVLTIGWIADEEGFDALCPGAIKLDPLSVELP
jgi:hypothetical protein